MEATIPNPNGNGKPTFNAAQQAAAILDRLIFNTQQSRSELFNRFFAPSSSIDAECGYPDTIQAEAFRQMYDRDPYARRACELMPKECFQVTPEVREHEDGEDPTDFDLDWRDLGHGLTGERSWYKGDESAGSPIWEWVLRADILSGIGSCGIILLGLDDGKLLDQPALGMEPLGPQVGFYLGDRGGSGSKDTSGTSVGVSDQVKDIYGSAVPSEGQLDGPAAELYKTMGTDAYYFQTQFSAAQPATTAQGADSSISKGGKGAGRGSPADGKSEGNKNGKAAKGKSKKNKRPPRTWRPAGAQQDVPRPRLLFMRVFDQSLFQITRYEQNLFSPRFGQPVEYLVTLNDPRKPHTGVGLPLATVKVHWTRVIHLADHRSASEVFGDSRIQVIWNNLHNLRKIYGCSGEGYWRTGFPFISLETVPNLGGDVQIDQDQIRDMMGEVFSGLKRWMVLAGMSARTVAGSVTAPDPHVNINVQAICIALQCPLRVFQGSERGQLASQQDDANWNDRVRARQLMYVTPWVIRPLVDRLIWLGVLTAPEDHYAVKWPDLESLSDLDKIRIAQMWTQTLSSYAQGSLDQLITFRDFLVKIMHLSDDEAQAIIKAVDEDPDATGADSYSLGKAGGVGGLLALYQQFAQGVITADEFKAIVQLFFKVDDDTAEVLVPKQPPAPPGMPPGMAPPGQPGGPTGAGAGGPLGAAPPPGQSPGAGSGASAGGGGQQPSDDELMAQLEQELEESGTKIPESASSNGQVQPVEVGAGK